MTVNGTTNLPDETKIRVKGTLAVLDQFDPREEPGYPSVGEGGAIVMDGTVRGTFALDLSDIMVLAETSRVSDKTSPPNGAFDEDVVVCALVSTGKTLQGEWAQPLAVRKILGDFGEAMRESPGVERIGTALPDGPAWAISAEAMAP